MRDEFREIVTEVHKERIRQNDKWVEQNHHPYIWLAILGEEVGEANKAVLESDIHDYRTELIQVAAVAIAAIESLDNEKWQNQKEKISDITIVNMECVKLMAERLAHHIGGSADGWIEYFINKTVMDKATFKPQNTRRNTKNE